MFSQQSATAVPSQDARNTEIIDTNTHLPLPHFTDLSAWEQRKSFLRNQILVSAGLSPMPKKTPLHSQVFGKLEAKDYTIEKVLIETLPGFYLGGNLYRPRNDAAKHPAILNPTDIGPMGVWKTRLCIPDPPSASVSRGRDMSSLHMTWSATTTRSSFRTASAVRSSGSGLSVR